MKTKLKSRYPEAIPGLGVTVFIQFAWVLIMAVAVMVLSTCTIVLSSEVGGTSSGTGGVLDPMLAIFEEELLAAFDASRSLVGMPSDEAGDLPARGIGDTAARGLAGGVNSIKHGLPSTTVARVRARVRDTIVAQGLEKSRDLEKVAPAIASATAAALLDPTVVGETALTEVELIQVNAVASRGVAKSLNAQGVSALAEGLDTAAEKQARLEALTRAASGNASTLGISNAGLGDALQKILLMVVDAGNSDLDPAGSGASAPETLLASRASSLVAIAAALLDGKLSGTACSTALNDLANATVVGLGGTAIASATVDATGSKLQSVVQDGVLTGLFLAYYKFSADSGLSASALRSAIDFADAMTALGTGAYTDKVSAHVQAVKGTIVPAADTKARKAAIISSPAGISGNVTLNATPAATVGSGTTTTWTSGSDIYVASNINVNGNLVIQPGVTVYLAIGANISINSTGSITATGTLVSPIVFTRASSSAWGSLIVHSGGNSFAYCDISGGTDGIKLNGRAVITNCLFHGNAESGLDAQAATFDIMSTPPKTTVRDSYSYGNGGSAVIINQYVDFDESNHFYDPQTAEAPDPVTFTNRILFYGDIDASVDFTITEVPYLIDDLMEISAPAIWAIDPGVVVKLRAEDAIYVYQGARITAGAAGQAPVIFTSYRDGSAGGDITGQGAAGVSGDWSGIDLRSSANVFVNCEFRYADHAVRFDNYGFSSGDGAGSFAGCVFRNCKTRGLNGYGAGSGTVITGSSFFGNDSYPVTITPEVNLDNSNIFHAPGSVAPTIPEGNYKAIVFRGNVTTSLAFKVTELPYLLDDTTEVRAGATLTLDPGVIIKVQATDAIYVLQGGRIDANGTSEAPVVFTSFRDGSVGGDTVGQGGAGAAGDWSGIDLRSSDNDFDFCEFRYADTGVRFDNFGFSVGDGAGVFSDCIFRNCLSSAFNGYGAGNGTVIARSNFYANESYPVYITQEVQFDASNSFHAPGSTAPVVPVGSYKAIVFRGDISKAVSFPIVELPYLLDDTINLISPATLTIAPGAVVKIKSADYIFVLSGARISAIGTTEDPIVFTSYRDGSVGGDTAGQGSAGIAGDWSGIDLRSTANAFEHCEIRYAVKAVRFDNYGLSIGDGGATIKDSVIAFCSNGGIDATDASSTTVITNNTFANNNANGTTIWDLDINGNVNVNAGIASPGNTGVIRP